ncbi:hypothetical protein [Bradyrhizobium elkanii]|uniref:hypothetical protein n=1 Tax=Bradyrhizobium elkanii TaxID=29448 RepID=UPI000841DC98|nr:hypothetical protein [Bradyrhizobium elkanii]ODM71666.1 hypothetical protein A6X20_06910 [Bradyrhizobium elkanii]ODM79038.1 hypothetical protein A6452_28495 [Bradyrhizobium elkanii]
MFASALEAFAGLTGLSKTLIVLGLAGVIVAGASTAYGVWHHEVYQSGVNDTIAGIARADDKLVGQARASRKRLQACQARAGHWDQSTGECR